MFKKRLSWFGHLISSWLSQLLRQHQAFVELCVEHNRFKAGLNIMLLSNFIHYSVYLFLAQGSIYQTVRCSALVHCKVIPRALWNVFVVFISQQNEMQKFMF